MQIASLEAIPWIGTLFGSAANLAHMQQITLGAGRIFQQRWLRSQGKIEDIPAELPEVGRT